MNNKLMDLNKQLMDLNKQLEELIDIKGLKEQLEESVDIKALNKDLNALTLSAINTIKKANLFFDENGEKTKKNV